MGLHRDAILDLMFANIPEIFFNSYQILLHDYMCNNSDLSLTRLQVIKLLLKWILYYC